MVSCEADDRVDEALQAGVDGPVGLRTAALLPDVQPDDVQHSCIQPAHTTDPSVTTELADEEGAEPVLWFKVPLSLKFNGLIQVKLLLVYHSHH